MSKEDLFSFYQNFDAGETMWPYNLRTIHHVMKYKPESVLEFGCNNGKNMKYIKRFYPKVEVTGIDFSIPAIMKAAKKGLSVKLGNEESLNNIQSKSIDVVFTISVLDHIPEVDRIIANMERIARTAIYFTETNDIVTPFYFAHDYEKKGYKPLEEIRNPPNPMGNGALYTIYEKKL